MAKQREAVAPVSTASSNRYVAILIAIFESKYQPGEHSVEFTRQDITDAAQALSVTLPKNLGDLIYTFRYRLDMPPVISARAAKGKEWLIEGVGRAKYRFRESAISRIEPRTDLLTIKIPDATPELVAQQAQTDEQALLAKVRYNRLVDIFLGVTAYSLQNHWRTTVASIGQIEVDEIYLALNKHGHQFVIPVQAKGGNDRHGAVQTRQDVLCCWEKFPLLSCRAVSAQFLSNQRIAMFELALINDEVKVVEERHYQLVPASHITASDLALYRTRSP